MAFLDRFLRQRRPTLYDIPGYAGGNLGDELDQQPQNPPTRQVLTPTNQQNITRPRVVNPFQQRLMQQPDAPVDFRDPGSPPVSMSRERRTQPRDYVADDSAALRELQSKPLSLRDKAGMVSQVISQSLGGKPLPTRRERALAEAEGQLGQDVALDKQRILSEQSQMIPVTLANGQTVMVPAKTAGSTASQQQGFSIRRQQLDAHNKRWDMMATHEAAQDAQRLYNSGAADDDEDLKAAITQRMGLPPGTKLPNHDKGQVQVDAQGNFILISPKSGDVRAVTRDEQPVSSMQQTTEAGRNRRSAASITAANARAAAAQAGANQRATGRGTGTTDRASQRRAAELTGKIESARQAMMRADERLQREPNNATAKKEREEARSAGEAWAVELNNLDAGYEAGPGAQGYSYYKKRNQSAQPSTPARQFNEKAFRDAFQSKHGRQPTDAEIEPYRNAR